MAVPKTTDIMNQQEFPGFVPEKVQTLRDARDKHMKLKAQHATLTQELKAAKDELIQAFLEAKFENGQVEEGEFLFNKDGKVVKVNISTSIKLKTYMAKDDEPDDDE